jgi:hypothetical protein
MIYLTNNLSNMVIALFGTSTLVFFTRFFQQLGEEIPRLDNIVNSPGSLQVAIYSLIGALITFCLKQATSIKNIENSTKNTETLLTNVSSGIRELNQEVKTSNENQKKMLMIKKEQLRGSRTTDSLIRRLPHVFDEEHEE